LFVIRSSYWSCRIGNEPQDFHLSPHEVESKAIASFGSKELVDPDKGRKVFQQIERRARHQLGRYSRPFPAANAHFVPWDHVPELIDQLQALKAEFDQAVEDFLTQYPQLRAEWQSQHPDIPDMAYPAAWDLRKKFSLCWHMFKVAGAANAMAIDDIQAELAGQQVRAEQLAQMKQNLQAECQQFAGESLKTLVPRVLGQTAEAQRRKGSTSRPARQWDEPSFFKSLEEQTGPEEVRVARTVLDWARSRFTRLSFGKGAVEGSIAPVLDHADIAYVLFILYSYGSVEMQFQHQLRKPPFDDASKRRELLNRLNNIPGVSLPANSIDKRPSFRIKQLNSTEALEVFFQVVEWYLSEVRKALWGLE